MLDLVRDTANYLLMNPVDAQLYGAVGWLVLYYATEPRRTQELINKKFKDMLKDVNDNQLINLVEMAYEQREPNLAEICLSVMLSKFSVSLKRSLNLES